MRNFHWDATHSRIIVSASSLELDIELVNAKFFVYYHSYFIFVAIYLKRINYTMKLASLTLRRWSRLSFPLKSGRLRYSAPSQYNRLLSSNADNSYDHIRVERKWQDHWEKHQLFKATRRAGHPKKYVLDMFPYPSGDGLHVGHPEGYTATDIMSRYWRMRGYDVLHPMGWDSFGLPAEQHAINTGTHPAATTLKNIATFKRQLKSLGFSYDWSRELATTDNDYVRWTQWIFLKMFKKGLASQAEVMVNWCPGLGTVLANEEIIDGVSERGGFPVVRQPLRQWVLHITHYADQLEQGLDGLKWPEGTLATQKQWIGRSAGVSVKFSVVDHPGTNVEVFTTRADTLMGVTYLVVAPENPLVLKITDAAHQESVKAYIQDVCSKSDMERTSTGKDRGKTGVNTGAFGIHPISGEKLPIWIADYVLASYGTGSVMAVPAHDERDFQFAKKFNLSIKQVIAPTEGPTNVDLPFCENGTLCNSSSDLNGLTSSEGQHAIVAKLQKKDAGAEKVTYKLRDWVFSRQRYWGEPIPIYFPVEILTNDGSGSPLDGSPFKIHYNSPIAVEDSELPLKLPNMTDFKPGDDPAGCLARAKEWRYFQKEGKWFARETNTMPQWAGSCWYYLRFTDPHNKNALFGEEGASWLPVDLYVGGQEHAVLHLLYARFWHKALFDLGIVNHSEPFTHLVHQGMILGTDGEKMSKSRGNVINPDDVVKEHGADVLRLYEMFMGPLEAVKPWQTGQLSGVVRFRDRVYNLVKNVRTAASLSSPEFADINVALNKTVKGVTADIDRMAFNTVISKLMVFTNMLRDKEGGVPKAAVDTLLLLLSPLAPHVCEECWELLGHKKSLMLENWPAYDDSLCSNARTVVVVQINGKVRGKVEVEEGDLSQEALLDLARSAPGVAKWLTDQKIKKIIYIPGKIMNLLL